MKTSKVLTIVHYLFTGIERKINEKAWLYKESGQDFSSKYASWFTKTSSVSNAIQQGVRGQDL